MSKTLHQKIVGRLAELGRNPFEAARKGGLERGYINDFISGRKKSIRDDKLESVAKALDWSVSDLLPGTGDHSTTLPNASKPIQLRGEPLISPLRRYSSAFASQGGAVLMDEIFDFVPIPAKLVGVEDAYAVYVHGDSMEEVLFAGDTVYCHPFQPVRKNDFVVVQVFENGRNGPVLGFIKRFVSDDADKVVVKQYNPKMTLEFPKNKVKAVHRVVQVDPA